MLGINVIREVFAGQQVAYVDPTADIENLQVGEDAVWLAPSGKVYAGLITAKEYCEFNQEWQVHISDVEFTTPGKIVQTGGWMPVSHCRRYADWLADYLAGVVSL